MEVYVIVIRYLLTFILSFAFGYQRQRAHKPIGFGTYTFVAIGACTIGVFGSELGLDKTISLFAAAITGIGFLGAGAVIRMNDKIFGLTSAAGVWIFAIFGLMMGMGNFLLGAIMYICVIMILISDKYMESRGIGSYQKKLVIQTNKIVPEKELDAIIAVGSIKLKKISIDLNKKDNNMIIAYQIEGRKSDINQIPQRLYEKPWFSGFKVE